MKDDALEVAKYFSEGVVQRCLKSCGSGQPWCGAGAPSLVCWGAGLTEGGLQPKFQSGGFGLSRA